MTTNEQRRDAAFTEWIEEFRSSDEYREYDGTIFPGSAFAAGWDAALAALADDMTLSTTRPVDEAEERTPTDADYYDPARQDRISEHECIFEDGVWWFGHGMPCKHPKLHAEPQGEPSDAQVEAALIAHLGYDPAPAGFPFKDGEKDRMRAALRAASEQWVEHRPAGATPEVTS